MVFTGEQIPVYRALAVRRGLILYAQTGIKPNTAWTPMNMLKAASSITGIKYKRGEYLIAAQDIQDTLNNKGVML
jgi:hypothetical protein